MVEGKTVRERLGEMGDLTYQGAEMLQRHQCKVRKYLILGHSEKPIPPLASLSFNPRSR